MSFFYNLNKKLANLASKQDAKQIAESKQTESIAQSPLTRALNEGSMKHAMHKDAERMSREKFCAKWGDENGEFWDNIFGDLNEGSMKDAMWHDAERMNRNQFCSKWGQEHGEFWDNISGDLAESKKNSVVAKLAPYAEKIAMIADNGASAIEQDPTMLDNENDAAQTAKALRTVANLFRQDVGQGLAAVVKKLWAEPREMLVGEVKQRLKIDLAKLHNRAFPDADVQFEDSYSAKKAAAGKDIGKPGKNFSKIAKGAAERYGSKEAGERVAGAVLNKLRHPTEEIENEGNAFTGALAKTPKGDKFKVGNKEFTDTSSLEEVGMTPKQKSFAKLAPPEDKITFADKIAGAKKEVDEMLGDVAAEAMRKAVGGHHEDMDEGYAEMDAWLKNREKEKGTGNFDIKDTGYSKRYTRRAPETDIDSDTEVSTAPKLRGRPKGKDKGPERVTAKSYKYKSGRPAKTQEDLDTDGVMMTRPSNMSSESTGDSEYDQEGKSAKHDIKTIVRHAQALYKILGDNNNLPEWVQSKLAKIEGMMTSVDNYMQNQGTEEVAEKAPPGAKAERMVKHIKKSLSKDGKLSDKDKAIAYATTWKAHNKGKVEKESTDKEDSKAERAGKKVAKDIEHDEDHKGRDDNRAERAGKRVTKDIEYDDKKDKEEKVDETSNKLPKAAKGFQFGKGVYEGFDNRVETMINEGMSVNISIDEQGKKSISVNATDEDAEALAQLLKMAGLEGAKQEVCPSCGSAECSCEEELDENQPDWPTNSQTSDDALQYAGGLNKPKSTGQTTTPVIASQLRRQVSMEENLKLERSLFNTWKNYKG